MKRNKNLLIILIAQVILIIALFFSGQSKNRLDFDNLLFTVSDTASISKIELLHQGELVILESIQSGWYINGQEIADPSLISFLKTTVNRVAVTRPIASKQKEEVYQQLEKDGALVLSLIHI